MRLAVKVFTSYLLMCWMPLRCFAAAGDLDISFGNAGSVQAAVGVGQYAIALQSDGKIVLAGESSSSFCITRYRSDGALDTTFNGTGKVVTSMGAFSAAECVAVQSNGKIVAAGGVYNYFGVARYNANGTLDVTFNGTGKVTTDLGLSFASCRGVAVQSDGKIVVAGTSNSPREVYLVRYNVGGSLDTTFGGTGIVATGISAPTINSHEQFTSLVIQPDGKILTVGCEFGVTADMVVARYNPNGTLDTSFNNSGKAFASFSNDDVAFDVTLQRDGRIVVAGLAGATLGVSPAGGDFGIVRFLPNGVLDATFNGIGKATVAFQSVPFPTTDLAFDVATQPNGKIVVVGTQNYAISDAKLALARLNSDGTLDTAFGQSGKTVSSASSFGRFAFQSDGKLLLTTWNALLRFEGDPPAAEIFVEQPVGTPLYDGSSSVSFGSVGAGASTSLTFTVKNIGNFAMTGIGVTIDGTDAADFSVTTTPAATLPAFTGMTTFTVKFSPALEGVRSAVLHIANDDPDESSFDIDLTGNGLFALGLGAGSFSVKESDGVINIPVVRTGGSAGTVTVNISTTNGTAVAPADFTALSNVVVTFDEGETLKVVPIDISDPAGTPEGNEIFTVKLSSPVGAVLGVQTTATVQILDSVDLTKPGTPVITAPGAGATLGVGTVGTVLVTGTAADNRQVGAVEISHNGGSFVPVSVTLTGSGAGFGTTATFSAVITPTTGSNSVAVRVIDALGNVSASVATRTFKVQRPLLVNLNSLGTVTAGFAPSSFRDVGRSYTITATPSPPKTNPPSAGALFTGWSVAGATNSEIGITETAKSKQTLTFIFREGLELTANFVANPYASTVVGTYNGLIRSSTSEPSPNGTMPGVGSEGHFTATVQSTGAFSGKLTIDGFVLNVAGVFDEQGRARFGTARALTQVVARPGKPSLTVKLDIGGPSGSVAPAGTITGTVTATEFKRSTVAAVSDVEAYRAYYTGTTGALTVPDAYLTVTGTAASPAGRSDGLFTVILPRMALSAQPLRIKDAFAVADYPQGTGVGTVKVSKSGAVTMTGTLADGTAVTAAGTLSQDLHACLFAQLYALKGFLSAKVKLDVSEPGSDLQVPSGSEALWSRPFVGTSHYYPYGWPEVIMLDLKGAKYVVIAGQSVMKAPDGADGDDLGDLLQTADADGNVELRFSEGQLSEQLLKHASLSTGDLLTRVPDNDPTFTATITRSTGAIAGTFTHTDDTVPAYKAVIFQKGPDAGAYGFFLTKQPAPIDYTGESGGVTLIGEP